jgi:hypothetical protein
LVQKRQQSYTHPAVRRQVNTISIEGIVSFFSQIPEFQDSLGYWGEHYFESLKRPEIEQDVPRLESLGVRRESTAIGMATIKLSPIFDNSFAQFGDKRERKQRAKKLLTPLPELNDPASCS